MVYRVETEQPVDAILCSDIHLSDKPPACRSEEPDWFTAMSRPLNELSAIQEYLDCPVICAGDVFDKHNASPALISFALQHLPKQFHAIPGQHDLPGHRVDMYLDSAYGVCVQAGKIKHLEITTKHSRDGGLDEIHHGMSGWKLYPFQWGEKVRGLHGPPEKDDWSGKPYKTLAINHQFVWKPQATYPGAPESGHCKQFQDLGYDICHFGDNHIGFHDGCVVNSGGFMRRTISDLQRDPTIWLLCSDGSVVPHYLDTSKDVYSETDAYVALKDEFASELHNMVAHQDRKAFYSDGSVDFKRTLLECAKSLEDETVVSIIRNVLAEAEEAL